MRTILFGLTLTVAAYALDPFRAPLTLAPAERAVLMDFYRATGGDHWKDHTGWGTDASPCEWHGVTCAAASDDDQAIVVVSGLRLRSNNLTGSLPRSLADLTHLEVLDLTGNPLDALEPAAQPADGDTGK